ncbi:hypothetical protein KC343_g3876 [Hortaea werneckii]|nr:hypothetical protein KC352_g9798 [Hortaea werneckii]KAI7345780.1 hypothetical protein KC320_g8190 [Hortaea werneckii]KAI7568416.1 hypothetical protein KC317_g4211 [Hortaea werneckii]KAI7621098.1 hypothetical protein KC346_g3804 [Hortaea werneckii]KAI7631677.1 hypothetical protein KC343_g3876 [Hortaea werneckii]
MKEQLSRVDRVEGSNKTVIKGREAADDMSCRGAQVDDLVRNITPDELKINKLVKELKKSVKDTEVARDGYYELSRVHYKFPAHPHEATDIHPIKSLLFNSLRLLDRMRRLVLKICEGT